MIKLRRSVTRGLIVLAMAGALPLAVTASAGADPSARRPGRPPGPDRLLPDVPSLDAVAMRERVAAAPVARLATIRPDGTPRLVPITFVLVAGLVCSAVDEVKPKRSTRLARLDDVRDDPRVGVLVDHYADDWTQLWWIRLDGTAAVQEDGPLRDRALAALAHKYAPYAARPPSDTVLTITPTSWTGWTAS